MSDLSLPANKEPWGRTGKTTPARICFCYEWKNHFYVDFTINIFSSYLYIAKHLCPFRFDTAKQNIVTRTGSKGKVQNAMVSATAKNKEPWGENRQNHYRSNLLFATIFVIFYCKYFFYLSLYCKTFVHFQIRYSKTKFVD
jgi:hypothetical protein